MAKQANRMMIGGFVVTAIFLFMISLVVFGSGRFFNRTETFVLHFDGSIKGLQVGSPVLFQGVQIGSVTSIVIQTHEDDLKASIPVTIQIEPQKFEMGSSRRALTTPEETLPQLIALGLRGVLTLQSFITGQLMIEFDFYPDSQAVYRDTDKEYIEIPTIKSSTERLAQSLQQLDIEGLEKDVKSVLEGISQLVNDPDMFAAVRSLSETMQKIQLLVEKLDTRLDRMADGVDTTLAEANNLVDNVNRRVDALADRLEETLVDVDTLVNNINSRVDPLATGTETAIRAYTQLAEDTDVKLQNLMSDLDETLLAARDIMSPDATLMVDLRTTLEEISDAARSFRLLADYLAQHPEALIQGKTN
jgi:paraquat-inducible protein B